MRAIVGVSLASVVALVLAPSGCDGMRTRTFFDSGFSSGALPDTGFGLPDGASDSGLPDPCGAIFLGTAQARVQADQVEVLVEAEATVQPLRSATVVSGASVVTEEISATGAAWVLQPEDSATAILVEVGVPCDDPRPGELDLASVVFSVVPHTLEAEWSSLPPVE